MSTARSRNIIALWVVTHVIGVAISWLFIGAVGVSAFYSGEALPSVLDSPLDVYLPFAVLWGFLSIFQGGIYWDYTRQRWYYVFVWIISSSIGWGMVWLSIYWAEVEGHVSMVIIPVLCVLGLILWAGIIFVCKERTWQSFVIWMCVHFLVGFGLLLAGHLPVWVWNISGSLVFIFPGALYGGCVGYILTKLLDTEKSNGSDAVNGL